MQQQKPTSTQTSQQQQQLTSSTLIQAGTSQTSSNAQQQVPESSYFNAVPDTQQHTDTTQPSAASVSANSPVQMPQNGYEVSINNAANVQQSQSYPQQQCIGAQAAWIPRGSNTLTYTQSMQPPEHTRTLNQTYCEKMTFN